MPGLLIIDDCSTFDITRFSVTDILPPNGGSQRVSLPEYSYGNNIKSKFVFKTKPIKITRFGIPPLHPNFYPDDSRRGLIKIPHDLMQPACNELFEMLEKIDAFMSNNNTKAKLFGAQAHKYEYVPIIKHPAINEEDEEDNNKKQNANVQLNFCTVKFFNDFITKDLTTSVFLKKADGAVQQLENIKTVTDLTQYLHWGSVVRLAITAHKVWINKVPVPGKPVKDYGITLKCLQIEITEPEPVYNSKYFEKNYIFGSKGSGYQAKVVEI